MENLQARRRRSYNPGDPGAPRPPGARPPAPGRRLSLLRVRVVHPLVLELGRRADVTDPPALLLAADGDAKAVGGAAADDLAVFAGLGLHQDHVDTPGALGHVLERDLVVLEPRRQGI